MYKQVLFILLSALISLAVNAQYEWRMNSAGRYVYVNTVTDPASKGTPASGKKNSGATSVSGNKYETIVVFSENLASVAKNRKYGFINEYDKLVIPFTYDYADNFFNGRALVKLNGKYGFIDKNGTIIIPLEYDKAERFDGYIAKVEKGNQRYEINQYGKIFSIPVDINPGQKKKASFTYKGNYYNGIADIIFNTKKGYVDLFDNEVIPAVYDNIMFFSPGSDKVEAQLNGKWGIINKSNQVIVAFIYDHIYLNGDLTRACLNNKWGTIDSVGKTVIPFKYEKMEYFSKGLAPVQLNNKWGYINEKGKAIIPLIYDYAGVYLDDRLEDVLFVVGKNNKRGVIDKSNKIIIPLIYEEVKILQKIRIYTKLGLKYYSFDLTGKLMN